MEIVKQSESWSSLGKLSPHGNYVFSPINKAGIKLALHGYYVDFLVDKPVIHVIYNFTLNLTMKINFDQITKQKGT